LTSSILKGLTIASIFFINCQSEIPAEKMQAPPEFTLEWQIAALRNP
jgi:hypothetical protein